MIAIIKENITKDAIAGHQAAINKLVESIDARMAQHSGNPIVDAQINQDMTALRILYQELREMQNE